MGVRSLFVGAKARERDISEKSSLPLARVSRVLHYDGNLVDSASSHTLVSKIKPCMSKYKRFIL